MSGTKQDEKLQERIRIRHAGIEIASMTKTELGLFLEAFFEVFPKDQRADFIDQVARYLYDDPKWDEVDKWMDDMFNRHPDYEPHRVAYKCCVYFKINRRMKPLLIIKAQKSKNRFFKRRAYHMKKGVYAVD